MPPKATSSSARPSQANSAASQPPPPTDITELITRAVDAIQTKQGVLEITTTGVGKLRLGSASEGVEKLVAAIQDHQQLNTIVITGHELGDAGATILARTLPTLPALTQLNLNENDIGLPGAQALSTALTACSQLTRLCLNFNSFSPAGTKLLMDSLHGVAGNMTVLMLGATNLGDEGVADLASKLPTFTSLTELNLFKNGISDAGAAALVDYLKTTTSLKSVVLSLNMLSPAGIETLRAAVASNPRAVEISLQVSGQLFGKAPKKPLHNASSTTSATSSSSSSSTTVAEPLASYPPPGELPPATALDPLPADSPLIQLQADVTRYVSGMLVDSLMYDASKGEHLFILYDDKNELTRLLARGYRGFIENNHLTPKQATFANFNDFATPDQILSHLFALKPHDSVILIQSQQFRLNDYRIRLELFKRSIRSIEHVHLQIIQPNEYEPYVAALAFSPKDYGALAYTLKDIVDHAKLVTVESQDGSKCVYSGGMQESKLNIGDYRHMAQVGGTYPIGEVFSEAAHLSGVNGQLAIFGYPSLQKQFVLLEQPILLDIKEGVLQFDPEANPPILPAHATPEFIELLGLIRDGEGEIAIREFGLGLNRGMSRQRTVSDIFAFERQHGLHISLGKKHNVYKSDGIKGKQTKFHIDVFVDVKTITVDDQVIFQGNEYTVDLKYNYQGVPILKQEEHKQD